jgi:hypothetical protein
MGEWIYRFTHFLKSVLDGGEWPDSLPGRFIPEEGAPSIHRIGGWVGPRAGSDSVQKKSLASARNQTPILLSSMP